MAKTENRAWRIIKTGSTAPDAPTYASRSATFGSAVRNVKNATILVVNDEELGLQQYILAPATANSERVAGNAASAVGGRAEPTKELPELDTSYIGHLVADPSNTAARETQAGAAPSQVAEHIAASLPRGCWVAITLRSPSKTEVQNGRRWYDFRLGGGAVHHAKSGEVVVASVLVGGPDSAATSGILEGLASSLPGFDIESNARAIPGPAAPAATGIGLAAIIFFIMTQLHRWVPQVPQFDTKLAVMAMALPLIVGLLYLLRIIPTQKSKYTKAINNLSFPAPASRTIPARKPRKERTVKNGDTTKTIAEFGGDYPMARDAFLVGPSVILGLASPHTGTSSGAAVTQLKEIPPALRANIGAIVGSSNGIWARISQADRFGGLACMGIPGSGKALDLNTVIPTPNGNKRLSQINVGDEVYTDDGSVTTVRRLGNIFMGTCYELTFSDGQTVVADAGHLWNVSTHQSRLRNNQPVPQSNIDRSRNLSALARTIDVGVAASINDISTLAGIGHDISDHVLDIKGIDHEVYGGKRFYPLAESLLALSEFFLNTRGEEKFKETVPLTTNMTTEEMARCYKRSGGHNNLAVSVTPVRGDDAQLAIDPYLMGARLGDGTSGTITEGMKRIPEEYMHSSYAQRLEVLRGLMDSDGTVDDNGSCEISMTNYELMSDVLHLVRSLGIRAATIPENGVGTRWRITFTPTEQVFRMSRKASKIKTDGLSTREWNYITNIKPVASRPVRCITVDDASGVFMVEGFIKTHNSVFVQNVFAYDLMLKHNAHVKGSEWKPVVPGDVGLRNAMIAFENKGRDGVIKYLTWGRTLNQNVMVVEVADPRTPAIDMFDVPGSAKTKAAFFVDSMVYAFGDQAIANQSANTLKIVFNAALQITNDDLAECGLPPMSPVEIAGILLCTRGDELGEQLAGAFTKRVAKMAPGTAEHVDGVEAVQMLGNLYGKVTPSQRRTLVTAPQNKIEALLTSPSWWDVNRPRGSWSSIINNYATIVINTGQSTSGHIIDDNLTAKLTSMLMYTLQRAIIANCDDWGSQGKAVTLYSDELSLLVGGGDARVFTWIRDQGRSFGIRPTLATQRPEQLPPQVKAAVLSFTTFLWYAQNDPATIASAVADLSADGSDWSASDITTLEPYHGVLRASVNKQRQPAVPVKVAFWGGNEANFVQDQLS